MKKNYVLSFFLIFAMTFVFAQEKEDLTNVSGKTLDENGNAKAILFSGEATLSPQKPNVLFQQYLKISKEDEMKKIPLKKII